MTEGIGLTGRLLAEKLTLAEADNKRLRAALEECCRISGADLSDGFPTWPELPEFAIECVTQLREDSDDPTDLDRADRLREENEALRGVLEQVRLDSQKALDA